jgi:hypothetical protein
MTVQLNGIRLFFRLRGEQANMVARWVAVEQGGKGGSALTAGGSRVREEGEWWRRGQGELEGAATSAPFIASGG